MNVMQLYLFSLATIITLFLGLHTQVKFQNVLEAWRLFVRLFILYNFLAVSTVVRPPKSSFELIALLIVFIFALSFNEWFFDRKLRAQKRDC